MRLITIGNRCFNLDAITNASYDVVCTEGSLVEDRCTNAMGCTISFGCDDILIFYGEEAVQAWEMIEAQSINLTKLSKEREAIAS